MINNQKKTIEQTQIIIIIIILIIITIMICILESNRSNYRVATEIEKNLEMILKAAFLIQYNIHDLQV
jgi:hypothetical protein